MLAACKTDGAGDESAPAQPVLEDELPDAAAESTCELIFGCSCENPGHADEPTCVETQRNVFSEDQLAAQAAGLTYDAQCAGDSLALAEAAGCAPTLDFDCSTFCAPYHGDLGVDAACTVPVPNQALWSDCAQDLLCLQGTCQDPCGTTETEFLGAGEMCRDAEGEPLGTCDPAPGLFCDFETSTCVALPGVGEPCYGGEVCAAGAVCDWSGDAAVCVAAPGAGEACTYACIEGFYCDAVDGVDGTCVVVPGEGQPCGPQGACAENTYCDDTNTCTALPAWVCPV